MRLWRHSARRASPQPCAAARQSDFTPSTRLACSRAAHTHDSPVDLHAGAATGAADELYELVRTRRPSQWQDSERARIDALVSEVVAQNAPWPRAGLVGKWRLAYLQPGPKGEGVDRRIPFPEFGFNEQYQIFSSGRVTNVGEVLGPAVRVEVVSGNSERGVRLLSRGDIDVAFGLEAAFARWPEFKCERVASIEILPFVRNNHPILGINPTSKEPLVQFEFVVPSSSEPYTSIIQQMYEKSGKRPADWIHMTDYFQLVRRIVATSDAIGMVAKQFTENSWFRANFVALEGIGLFDPLTLCYAVRSRWQVKPAGRALVSLVRQAWRTASSD